MSTSAMSQTEKDGIGIPHDSSNVVIGELDFPNSAPSFFQSSTSKNGQILFMVGIVTHGEVFYQRGNEFITLHQGDLFCFLTFTQHKLFAFPDRENYLQVAMPIWKLFDCVSCEQSQLDLFLGHPIVISLSNEDTSLLDRWRKQLKDNYLRKLTFEEIKLAIRRSVFLAGDTKKISNPLATNPKAHRHVYNMIRYIWLNYTTDINLKNVANFAGLNKNFAMGVFKKKLGISILQFITRLRLNHAANLLTTSNEQITDIAYQSGFSSVTRFYEVFRAFFDETPMKFRQKNKNNSLSTVGTIQLSNAELYTCT